MQNRNLVIAGVVIVVVAIAAFVFLRQQPLEVVAPERIRKEIYNFDPSVCPGETVTLKMTDPYLRGLIEEGTDVPTVINQYSCAPLERGDVVLYRFSEFDDPVFRRAVAIAGDKYDLNAVEGDGGGWELVVNGKKVRGVKGEAYTFGGEAEPPLKLAVAQNGGRVGKDQAIVFSSFPPGDRDSGVFGMISTGDIIGKATTGSAK